MIFSRVPFLASSALSDAVPSADEQCFWVDENDNVVCTDAGHQTVLSHILTYWIDEDATAVCNDQGQTVVAFHHLP